MINYSMGILVLLNLIKLLPPFLTPTTVNPINIFLIILLIVAFEIVTYFTLVRRKNKKSASPINTPQLPSEPSKEPDLPATNEPKLPPPELPVEERKSIMQRVSELNEILQPYGFAYSPEKDLFYSITYGWQRDFGYCQLYDEMSAPLCMIIDCEPIRFNYGGKKWLIELWKGQYGMTTGCEIGIYNTDGPTLDIPGFFNGTFYQSASEEDFLPITITLRKKDKVLFSRTDEHWWITGFVLGEFSNPSDLILDIQITLKDTKMCELFVDELIDIGYERENLQISDSTVSFTFNKPFTKQPFTRIPLTETLMQKYNKQNCEAYQLLTKNVTNTLDKLDFVRTESPRMYQQIISIGKPKQLYSDFEKIKSFIDNQTSDK